eukprot:TRINITY_DN2928_c1_g2_i1.p1 TRINITY_DN2928_c1_g2~~TRINITY_DN2928_c1_g2_i1.p1  ORF type:complete len:286 (+),score=30.00 TRINITY_DN2928_c1_g2_i1:209-1066(+)
MLAIAFIVGAACFIAGIATFVYLSSRTRSEGARLSAMYDEIESRVSDDEMEHGTLAMTETTNPYNQSHQLSTPIAFPATATAVTESPVDVHVGVNTYHSASHTIGSLQDSPLKESKHKRRRKKRTPPPWEGSRASPTSSLRRSSTKKSASHSHIRRSADDSAEELRAMNSELVSKRKQFKDKLLENINSMSASDSLQAFDIPKVSSSTSLYPYDDDVYSSGIHSPRSMFNRTHSYIRSPVEPPHRTLRSAVGFEDYKQSPARQVTPQSYRSGAGHRPSDWSVHAV